MSRRLFLKQAASAGAAIAASRLAGGSKIAAQSSAPASGSVRHPIRIFMGGYSPASTGFSVALKQIGTRLEQRFGNAVEIKYVYNILDLGYRGEDILWLVEQGMLTLGYQSSSYLTDRVSDLGAVDLPFIFSDAAQARSRMDGRLGQLLTSSIEAGTNYRIIGYFENGFRHVSNRLRPVRTPADMRGMKIRVLPSQVQARTFELLGAVPKMMDLSEAIEAVKAGTIDAQENPFANTVTYGVHKFHRFHSATNHFYLSRPLFVHRPSFDAWPRDLQETIREAVHDAVLVQREAHVKEEEDAMAAIRAAGGEILDLTPQEHRAFVDAVTPLYGEARRLYKKDLLSQLGV
jgi:tripartite ATP-independent transporter DctP family solute receptor